MNDKTEPTREEVEALLSAITPPPWKMGTNEGCKPIRGGKCARHRQAQYKDLTWTVGLADENENRANAAIMTAAPTLARQLLATMDDLAEARATLAAERGEAEGALPGWQYDFNVASWTRTEGEHLLTARRVNHNTWAAALQNMRTGDMLDYCEPPTAREAMRAADAALATTEPPDAD